MPKCKRCGHQTCGAEVGVPYCDANKRTNGCSIRSGKIIFRCGRDMDKHTHLIYCCKCREFTVTH